MNARGLALVEVPPGIDSAARFAGRPLLDRAAALARAVGLVPYFFAPAGSPDLRRGPSTALAPGSTGRDAAWLTPGERLPEGAAEKPIVVFRCDAAFVAGLLRQVLAMPEPKVGLRDDSGRLALARLSAADLRGLVPPSLAAAADDLATPGPERPSPQSPLIALDGGGSRDAARSRRAAEAALIGALENPRDGWFDGWLNRRLSRPITRALLALPISPNQVTLFSVLVGVLAAAAIARPGVAWPVLGALLIQLSAVLDCVDGELARVKVLESEWGERLDISADTVVHLATFVGIALHVWPELGATQAAWLGALFISGGLAAFVVVTRAERSEAAWGALDHWKARALKRLISALTTRDSLVLVLLAALFGLLQDLLIGAAIGAHVFWITVLWLRSGLRTG
jgi:phosphatidylglycerophosphate synthase